MPVILNIPTVYDQTDTLPLGGFIYKIKYQYNERDNDGKGRWRLSLMDQFDTPIASGEKILEAQYLFGTYDLETFLGRLVVIQMRKTETPLGFDNFGLGKDYELWYLEDGETLE